MPPEPLQEDPVIKQQQQFVDWLKNKGLYNQFDSAHVMQRMHEVWETCFMTGVINHET